MLGICAFGMLWRRDSQHTDLLLAPLSRVEAKRVSAMLRECGIARLAARKFLSLSYGEKRLTLLARALVQDPDWLLLDEVYNGLDADYRLRVDRLLEAMRRRGQSWVAAAHRAADVPHGTRRLIELSDGRMREIKSMLRADTARLARHAEEETALPRHSPPRARVKRSGAVLIAAQRGGFVRRLSTRAARSELAAAPRRALVGVRRQWHWKIQLPEAFIRRFIPCGGRKIVRAGFAAGAPISEWKKRVGYVSPELQSLYAVDVTVLELVASGRHASIGLAEPMTSADKSAARRWLRFFKLLSVATRRPRELSYGQLRRALIARAMTADPHILLLDEPLTGLDPKQRAAIKRLLGRLMRRQLTVVAAVHHAEDLPRGMTHALHLHKRQARCEDSHFAT